MFDFVDRRTDEERQRDFEWSEKRRRNGVLARGFTEEMRRRLIADELLAVGLVGAGRFCDGAELLIQSDGVTYRIDVSVAVDDQE